MAYFFRLSLDFMQTLAIDFGNTRIKAASFNNGEMLDIKVFSSVEELIKNEAFVLSHTNLIYASVTENHLPFLEHIEKKTHILPFTSSTPIPLTNLYQNAGTLGSDRLAAAIGAYSLYPNTPVLTIDCGTCIKFNFVNSSNEFLGGAISPGLRMRYKALNQFTDKLPYIELDADFSKLVGQNTIESINSGVINGTVAEIDGIIELYKQTFPNLKIAVTGGDADFFVKRLKNSIFAHPNLVLLGLNTILHYNLEKN